MAGTWARRRFASILCLALASASAGCRMVSRDKFEECHRLSQSLRTENAQLQDQLLTLRSQNQDLSERSVDDVRRLAVLEEANRRLETSVQAYQDERARLESAYKDLRASLPGALQPLGLSQGDGLERDPEPVPPLKLGRRDDPATERARLDEDDAANDEERPPANARPGARRRRDGWVPSRPDQDSRPISGRAKP